MSKLSVYLAGDTVVDYLAKFLGSNSNARIDCQVAPYNQVSQTLLAEPFSSSLLLWTSADIQIPSYSNLLSFEQVELKKILEEVSQFAGLINQACNKYDHVFMISWTFPPEQNWPLALSRKAGRGACDVLERMNVHLADLLVEVNNFYIIDQSILYLGFKKSIHDPRLYAMARIRYSLDYLSYVAEKITPIILATVDANRKLIICDLDNTLWSGIVGDDGIEGLKIGGNDPIGEAHLQLQKELKSLKNRGILLAISSKNDLKLALEAISTHPNMLLNETDFSANRINWNDKAINIAEIFNELNLLPSGAVFLDDNPAERKRVKEAFPDLLVPDLPADVAEWAGIINSMPCFETLSQSQEDINRTKSYLDETKRREALKLSTSIDDWLESLNLIVKCEKLSSKNIQRSTQLINKTNQFNLITRRLTEKELKDWSQDSKRNCYTFSVFDRYGDSGLTAFVSVESVNGSCNIVDFVMSCRVMGKGVEDAILSEVKHQIGVQKVIALIAIPTERNGPIQDFVKRITIDNYVREDIECPRHIKIIRS